ncbi:MAG: sensory rhodopsin transducer [Nitrospira sp.]
MDAIGRTRWALAEGYIPPSSHGPSPQMISHETLCLLNTSDKDAEANLTIYLSDREPVGAYRFSVPARRTKHPRFNELSDPVPIPPDMDYASVVELTVPIVVQQTRLDSRQAENALFSTVAFPA